MHGCSGQRVEKRGAVGAVRDSVVHQDDGTAIALPPDQTAEPLLEAQHRLGKGQLSERVRQHRAPGSLQRVARDPER